MPVHVSVYTHTHINTYIYFFNSSILYSLYGVISWKEPWSRGQDLHSSQAQLFLSYLGQVT